MKKGEESKCGGRQWKEQLLSAETGNANLKQILQVTHINAVKI